MRTVKAAPAAIDIAELAEVAQHEPVTVVPEGKPAFVAVSEAEFERLAEVDRKRRIEAGKRLLSALDALHRDIAASGATPDEIAAIEKEVLDED